MTATVLACLYRASIKDTKLFVKKGIRLICDMIDDMKQRTIVSIIISPFAFLVLVYVGFSFFVGTILHPTEFVKYAVTIGRAAITKPITGGAEALILARQVIKKGDMDTLILHSSDLSSSYVYSVPLPENALLQKTGANYMTYAVFASDIELHDYFHQQLSQQGWQFTDQLGSLYKFRGTFDGHNAQLRIIKTYYLTNRISELTYSITEQ